MPLNSFLKRPRLLYYFADKSAIPESFIHDSKVFSRIGNVSHPNSIAREGSLVRENLVIGHILPRYKISLLEALERKVSIESTKVFQELGSALNHLHYLGSANNDIHQGKIMVTCTVSAILISLEFCRQVGVDIGAISGKSSIEESKSHFDKVKRVLLTHEKG